MYPNQPTQNIFPIPNPRKQKNEMQNREEEEQWIQHSSSMIDHPIFFCVFSHGNFDFLHVSDFHE